MGFLAAGLLFDRQPPLVDVHPRIPVTVLIAARNESAVIAETLDYLAASDYDGPLHAMLIDNGSTDGTAEVARQTAQRSGLALTIRREDHAGKNFALNRGVGRGANPSRHHRGRRHVAAQVGDPGTRTDAVRTVGGWPAAIGEDIVLTWRLLQRGRVFHEPLALAFAGVPETLSALARQRSRWARGSFSASTRDSCRRCPCAGTRSRWHSVGISGSDSAAADDRGLDQAGVDREWSCT